MHAILYVHHINYIICKISLGEALWPNDYRVELGPQSKWVQAPVALLDSFLDKYFWSGGGRVPLV